VWSIIHTHSEQLAVTAMVTANGGNMPVSRSETPQPYPLLALKNIVVFPHSTTRINVGTPRSLDTIEEALERGSQVIAVARSDEDAEKLTEKDFYEIGTLCRIKDADCEGAMIQVSLEGLCRMRIKAIEATRPCYFVSAEEVHETGGDEGENRAWARQVRDQLDKFAKMRGTAVNSLKDAVDGATDVGHLADVLASSGELNRGMDIKQRQALLAEPNTLKRLKTLAMAIAGELDVAEREQKIKERVREQRDKNLRERQAMGTLRLANDHEAIADLAGNVLVSRDAVSGEAWDALAFVATTASDPVISAVLVILAARTTDAVLSVDADFVVIGGKVITRAATPSAVWPMVRVLPLLTADEIRFLHKACVLHLHAELP